MVEVTESYALGHLKEDDEVPLTRQEHQPLITSDSAGLCVRMTEGVN